MIRPPGGGPAALVPITFALACGAFCVASEAEAGAEDWRYLARDGNVEVAVDIDSFSGPPAPRTVRSVIVSTEAGDPIGYLVVAAAMNCDHRTISGVSASIYDRDGVLLDKQGVPPNTSPVEQAGGTAGLADAACHGAEITGKSFTSPDAFAAWVKAGATP